ncbi:MAG: GNAT family N-acetyltransferase, partial [Nocardioides sp.]
MPALPEGLTARPLTIADAQDVLEAVAAEELVDLGEVDISLEDLLSDWQRPSYDITASTVGVFDGGRLVAYGDVAGPDHAYAAVHPDHQGRGIGTAIAAWIRETARTRGSTRIGSQVPEGSAADLLMADLGYRVRWTAWDLELPEGVEITAYPLPDGFVLRDATPEDHAAAWTLIEDAVLEWSDRSRHPIDDFASYVWARPGFEPWNLRLLENASGELVGATHVYLSGD